MTLSRKREIVRRFQAGESLMLVTHRLAYEMAANKEQYLELLAGGDLDAQVEQVLREYARGRFRLKANRK